LENTRVGVVHPSPNLNHLKGKDMHRHAFHQSSRCQHRTPSGRRCRSNASNTDSSFCDAHTIRAENRREAGELAATLTGGLDEFTSAEPINQFLSRLLFLLAQDRISPRRGAVLAYIANLLLRSISTSH
jgi:hypothetical protein